MCCRCIHMKKIALIRATTICYVGAVAAAAAVAAVAAAVAVVDVVVAAVALALPFFILV